MCGIAGILHLRLQSIGGIEKSLAQMNRILAYRGPDGSGEWLDAKNRLGMIHRRLAIIDTSVNANQPMCADSGTVITYNGEIYNYKEIRSSLEHGWRWRSRSDTETILRAYEAYGPAECVCQLRGMFAFALWDSQENLLFCARDRFGIKPFFYAVVGDIFYFASEAKAILPFLPECAVDQEALEEYDVLQTTLGDKTLFRHVKQLLPGHMLIISDGNIKISRYWDFQYEPDHSLTEAAVRDRLIEKLGESLYLHLTADVEVGAYVSGGLDSSLLRCMAGKRPSFHGRFNVDGYDESRFAKLTDPEVKITDISAQDFTDNIKKIIWHMDFPAAGPGSFPQFMVAKSAAKRVKTVIGGQGGDELFGGYARYLLAYFEQCIKAAIDGTYRNGNFVVTPESIIPNLGALREYKPMIAEFWRDGLFGPLDERYYRLINRSSASHAGVFERFCEIFNAQNTHKEAYLDKMMHFDFKCLLPALLHVEDRMSMAHGLESRLPFLDHPLVEFMATVPANIKFPGGKLKHLLRSTFSDVLPGEIANRRDKMGFPVPPEVMGIPAGRQAWGAFSLDLWRRTFDVGGF